MSLSRPPKTETPIRRVAILFAGGPAPAANAVISTAAASFLRNDIQVDRHHERLFARWSSIASRQPLELGPRLHHASTRQVLRRTRNSQGILIGTARTNPGKDVSRPAHLNDPERMAPLATVYRGAALARRRRPGLDRRRRHAENGQQVQALPGSTARPASRRIPVVHLPKTIDNDYSGIDFTFGYFTAVETLASEIRNLLADAEAGRSYYLTETMGRSAGWLAYGAAIAGEASLVISVEDITGKFLDSEEVVDPTTGAKTTRPSHERRGSDQADRGHDARPRGVGGQGVRRDRDGRGAGRVPALAATCEGVSRDEHGHIAISQINLCRLFSQLVAEEVPFADRPQAHASPACNWATRLAAPAAGIRRHAGQPTGRGRLSGAGRRGARRRDGFGRRPARAELRPVRTTDRSGNPGDRRPARSSPTPTSTGWPASWRPTSTNERRVARLIP